MNMLGHTSYSKHAGKLSLAAVLMTVIVAASAAEINAEFSVGFGISDNIARTPANEVEEKFGVIGFAFDLTERTQKTDVSIRSNFDYVDYQDDTFDSELVGRLDALLNFFLIDERLTWQVQNNYGQQLFDPLTPSRPDNRENVNYFTTGPTLTLPLGGRNAMGLELLYSTVNYEIRPFDNERATATVSFGREIRKSQNLSVNVSGTSTEFDNEGLTPDFDHYEGYVRYESDRGRNTIAVDVGYTEIKVGADEGEGILVRVDWSRTVSAFSTYTLSGGTQYSDQGDIFRYYQHVTRDVRDASDVEGLGMPFQQNFFATGFALDRKRTRIDLRLDWSQEDHQDSDLDRDLLRAGFSLAREFSRKVFGLVAIDFIQRDYEDRNRKDDDWRGLVSLGYRFEPAFSISLHYAYYRRDSNEDTADFDEKRAFLRVVYTPAWGR